MSECTHTWSEAHLAIASNARGDVRGDSIEAFGFSPAYFEQCLEAAQRVEEGTWP